MYRSFRQLQGFVAGGVNKIAMARRVVATREEDAVCVKITRE
jgi:hypothetical protein